MSIKHGLMALLAEGPKYGAQLRHEFEQRTGKTWPLNVGQVYTTLGRLERDGFVQQDSHADDEGKIAYHLTNEGLQEVLRWWQTPVVRSSSPRDEIVIKCSLAIAAGNVSIADVLHTQRTSTMQHMRELTKRKRTEMAAQPADEALLLVLEHQIFATEAELRWLDHAEDAAQRLRYE